MKFAAKAALAALLLVAGPAATAGTIAPRSHNVIIFVADGLRYVSVTPQTAPTLWRLKTQGVDFTNSHSLYPTITTVNASAIATGHYIGDTGNFGNTIYSGFNAKETGNAPIAMMEDDSMLGQLNDHFGGNYLNETSLLAAAREAGYATAAMGKVGPTAIQDVTQRDGAGTIVMDDAFNTPKGITVSPDILAAIKAAVLADHAPPVALPNVAQQQYMMQVATKVVLPKLASSGKPFAMLYWSRDPDITQHAAADSKGHPTPGINSPSGRAAIKNADDTLAALLAALKAQGLDKTTDIFVTADHGFSTIDRTMSTTSVSANITYPDIPKGETPQGMLAIDLADALGLPLNDPHLHKAVDYKNGHHPGFGSGFIGNDAEHPDVMVIANGGSDHILIPGPNAKATATKVVDILTRLDYVSGVFADDALGDIPGALPMSNINWRGTARTPRPSLVVSFASHVIPGCKPVLMCAAEMADTSLETGQGMHGTFSRADTRNFQAAFGPSFRAHYADPTPISNADIAPTLAHILGLTIVPKGGLTGRVITEALKGGKQVATTHKTARSTPAANGTVTVLQYQEAGGRIYFDAAGFPGRTVGLTLR
jgi:arylsulfatase A-like enzyme